MNQSTSRSWADRPLSQRLTTLAVALVVVASLILTIANIQRETASFNAGLENQAGLFLNTLAYSMRDDLYRLEVDELADMARIVARQDIFTELRIYDDRGYLVADANAPGFVISNAPDALGGQLIAATDENIWFDRQSGQLLAGRKIELGGQTIGALSIGLSTAELDAQVRLMVLQSLGLAVLVTLAGALVSSAIARGIAQPLNQLTDIAVRMSQGQTTARSLVLADDEVGKLSRSFNQMASAIETRERELRDLAQGLELTVEERTAELRGANTMLRDEVELRKQSEAALLVAKDQALEASRLKTSLLANVSHDLRTPLNIIMGYSEILREGQFGELSEKGRDMANAILRSAGQLLNFVNNLLSQAQIDSGKLEVNHLPFRVITVVENARSISEALASSKGLTLTINVDPTMPEELVGDVRWVNQILYNLITNAIKFTEKGEVTVGLRSLNATEWEIRVTDTGMGISPEVQARIFEPFFRVEDPTIAETPGSGIGLSIVRQLTDALGGRLALDSQPGGGATFSVILPLHSKDS